MFLFNPAKRVSVSRVWDQKLPILPLKGDITLYLWQNISSLSDVLLPCARLLIHPVAWSALAANTRPGPAIITQTQVVTSPDSHI